jgi:hypothetical protein
MKQNLRHIVEAGKGNPPRMKKPTEENSKVGVVVYRHTRDVAADLVRDKDRPAG